MITALILAAITAVHGGTVRMDGERLRLLGIDAPEVHRCRKGRV